MKPKIAKASTNVVAIKKSEVVEPERDYSDFDKFLERGRRLKATYDRLDKIDGEIAEAIASFKRLNDPTILERVAGTKVHWPGDIEDRMSVFNADYEHYNRQALYDVDGENERLARRVISEQVTLLLGSLPNAVPHDPKTYPGMLAAEIRAAEPSAITLESTCRIIRRTMKFPPAICEVLALLEQEGMAVACLGDLDAESFATLKHSLQVNLAEMRQLWKENAAQLGREPKGGTT